MFFENKNSNAHNFNRIKNIRKNKKPDHAIIKKKSVFKIYLF